MIGTQRTTSYLTALAGCALLTLTSRPVYATDADEDGSISVTSEATNPSNAQSGDSEVRRSEPVTPSRPSSVFSQAQTNFRQRHWVESAIDWSRVAQGETADDIPNRQLSEYYLGICLFRLGLLQSSLSVFGSIAEGRLHLRFAETLPWLALLASQLPEPGDIVSKLGTYSESDIAQFNATGDPALKSVVNYWYGRGRYGAGQYDGAMAALQKVDK